MSPIIVALMAFLGPLLAQLGPMLAKLLSDWLSGLFNKTAKKVTVGGNTADDAVALVQASHDATPRVRVFRRAFLRKLVDHAADIATGAKLSRADKAELLGLATKAEM